ncbi:MBL fold metallo-hydrolase [Paenibacillus sp. sgz500958]|uniref:MBL fold metallo-hydrolase n=1 Tax=Paenibacillus sp. sgz500958 TaxID=3242475 RepID=UPI0036D33A7E
MEHKFQQLSPHVFMMHAEHETDRPILSAIMGERRTLLMDAGNSPVHAELFRQELNRRGFRQPDILALTHWHWDHTFGMSAWDIPVVAHEGTAQALGALAGLDGSDESLNRLAGEGVISEQSVAHIALEYGENRSIRVVEPDILFRDRISIDLGGISCELVHVGGDHSGDSCFLYVKEEQILFLGDALGPSVYGGPRKYSSTGFLGLLARAYGYRAEWYVESHGIPMNEEDFRKDLDAWERLARIVDVFGRDRDRVILELKAYLKLDELPKDLEQGLEYFMAGV